MNLEKLNSLDINNAGQVKELQQFLKSRGYYNGPIDGKWGGGTTDGAVKLRTDLTNTANTARDTAVANQQANDPTNNAIKGATEIAPYAVGFGGGAWAGHKGAKYLKEKNTAAAGEISQIAGNPKISGAEGERSIVEARSARNKRAGLQFLAPGALFASAEGMRRYVAPIMGPTPEDQKWINLGANADQGAGIGLTVHQLAGLRNQVGPVGALPDEALIRTRAAAERAPKPAAAPPNALPPPDAPVLRPNSDRLIAAARAAGAVGKLNKTTAVAYLTTNVTEANRAAVATELGVKPGQRLSSVVKSLASKPGVSSIVAPIIAGGIAYDAATGDAEAAGATPGQARARGAAAGAGAAALTGGAVYGLNKLAQVAPMASNALSIAGGATMPFAVSDMTDVFANGGKGFTPEEIQASENSTLNTTARNTPSWMDTGAVRNAREMAQVPEPNALARAGKANSGPLMQAAALQIPDNIPPDAAQQADIAGGMNPLAQAGAQPDAFGLALKDFLAFVQQEQAGQQGAEQ